ncbi:MAG TPA: YafY family protein [Polyangia bacterium]|jgi:predicted DNA-binding transcriptional regulator YafY|nr:YafY family protein [Polyangia bacterium]
MRRADRLFQIVQLLKVKRLTTAADLAQELEISTRTVYRDVQDLIESGVPIEGEAGVGYRLRKGFELPPMTFTVEELTALVLGARMVEAWADPDLGVAVRGAMKKVEDVLPEPLQELMLRTALFGPPARMSGRAPPELRQLRRALGDERWVRLRYVDAANAATERTVVPLGLYFWGKQWLLAAYCLLRNDYRSFRVDRVSEPCDSEPDSARLGAISPPVTLQNYIRAMEERSRCERHPDAAPPAPDS